MSLWRTLTDKQIGLFESDNIDVLYERKSDEILEASQAFFDQAGPRDTLLYYFSGHGQRISKDELILCARNTTSHSSSTLLATGVPCTSISHMIDRSPAPVVIIILDCCHSGAFRKGGDRTVLVDALPGTGRYVIAASHASESAADSTHKNQPSVFTNTLIQGLELEAVKIGGVGRETTIDELFIFIDQNLPNTGSKAQRKFDSSGTIGIARRFVTASVGVENAILENPQSTSIGDSYRSAAGTNEETWSAVAHRRVKHRNSGDLSAGDMRTWIVTLLLAFTSGLCFVAAFFRWPLILDSQNIANPGSVDPRRSVALVGAALDIIVMSSSIIEGAILRRRLRDGSARRELVIVLHSGILDGFRLSREIASYLLGVIIFSTLFGIENYDILWVTGLACSGGLSLISGINRSKYGDAAYLSGGSLLLVSAFLPRSVGDTIEFGLSGATAVVALSLGICMVTAWWLYVKPGLLIVICITGLLPTISDFIRSTDGIGQYVGLVGLIVAAVSWRLGGGEPLDNIGHEPSDNSPAPKAFP